VVPGTRPRVVPGTRPGGGCCRAATEPNRLRAGTSARSDEAAEYMDKSVPCGELLPIVTRQDAYNPSILLARIRGTALAHVSGIDAGRRPLFLERESPK